MRQVQRLFGGFVLAALLTIAGVDTVFGGGAAHAQPLPAQPAPTRPSDAPLPSCLDQTIKDQLGPALRTFDHDELAAAEVDGRGRGFAPDPRPRQVLHHVHATAVVFARLPLRRPGDALPQPGVAAGDGS